MAKSTLLASACLVLTSGFIALTANSQTSNLLNNPGFETDPPGENQNVVQWQLYGPNVFSESTTSSSIAHSGMNYFKVYSAMNSAVSYSGCYQDYISGPGATYSADGWMYTLTGDTIAGQNQAWIEVTFRDAGANILALYRTAIVTTNLIASGGFPKSQWNHLQITNQYDINSYLVTNTVTQLVAPPGTVFLRCQIVFQGDAANSGGSVYFDDLNIVRTSAAPYGNMNIVWNDEFNGTNSTPDPNVWTYDIGNGGSNPGWGNAELEYYTSRTNNAYVANGLLHIVARQESTNTQSFTSARMKTQGLFSFTYGRLEWRAQLPYGLGFWPALWMLGTNIDSIGWPNCGEIDVVENTGTNTAMVQSSIHYSGDATAIYNFTNGMATTNFHTYTLDWTTNALIFYVDGHLFETQYSPWGNSSGASPFPFNQPFFLIMNLAVGGNYVQNPSVSQIESQTRFPSEMLVDYVRIYRTTDPLRLAIAPTTSGGFILSWPSNIVCNLQGQTNSGIGTNWYQISTTTNQLAIQPAMGNAFYRLVSP